MAKPLELITELKGKDAENFLRELDKPISRTNRRLIQAARTLRFSVR